ncbi:hypothetical protein FLL45_22005 [Aliikangiella marina]|uniref:Uncharacterized protein n=1 Tax=Aliikangiella marina TaxID=1712262 RepID=A0A545T1B2_9GAMM|nr:hypothetical protein [Aliikangiella marina]TQV71004.1 hypothetical protein FLL45_22005 [Aliikangiella marina]
MYTAASQQNRTDNVFSTQDSLFFSRLTFFITVAVFGGFALNWINNPEKLGHITFWVGLHGFFSAAWYLLLIYQLRLSRIGKIVQHKTLGKLSVLLVVAILITGVVTALDLYQRLVSFGVFDPTDAAARLRAGGFIGSTFLQWAVFLILYILGLLNRRAPSHHKRFMIAAAIQMMPEGLNRLIHTLGLPGDAMLLTIFLVYLSVLAYDWKIENRVQWSTLLSFGLFTLLAALIHTLFRTQVWGDWVVNLLT